MLQRLELTGFKSFAKKTALSFTAPVTAVVGPNGSGKSNVAEAFRWVLGEQSPTSIRAKRGEDFIFHGSAKMPRQNQARVAITFANADRRFPIDYREVTISRTVHRDGVNEYAINGSRVRLKDVVEMLASVGIGASSHHIIGQGEADRVLLANPVERRTMIEDALGIKIYQYKKHESERKLEKTLEHMAQIESLRKEIAPHLAFLKKQADKIAAAERMRDELSLLYREYLKRESLFLASCRSKLTDVRAIREKLSVIMKQLESAPNVLETDSASRAEDEIARLKKEYANTRGRITSLLREAGKLEGMLAVREEVSGGRESGRNIAISRDVCRALDDEVSAILRENQTAPTLSHLTGLLDRLVKAVRAFLAPLYDNSASPQSCAETGSRCEKERMEISGRLAAHEKEQRELESREREIEGLLAAARRADEARRAAVDRAGLESAVLASKKAELETEITLAEAQKTNYERLIAEWKREQTEAAIIAGRSALDYESFPVSDDAIIEDRSEQDSRRRKIERLKLKLEDIGGDGRDIAAEHAKVAERDAYLAHEMGDIEKSITGLRQIITELAERLDTEFEGGIRKINAEFGKFVQVLFGGGRAELVPVVVSRPGRRRASEDEVPGDSEIDGDSAAQGTRESGIDIIIELPKKRVRGLQMLSGGERALVSLALVFATSQIHPPPFLVLDETDAALDEVNSGKYGAMVSELAKNTQLIVVTHNRETMTRADTLYGVTMGSDGVSQLLSIGFLDQGST